MGMDVYFHYAVPGLTFSAIALLLVAGITVAYLGAAYVQRRANRYWSGWRIVAFTAGTLLLAIAISPPLVEWAHHDLRGHMVQHLLIGMLAPLGLVLAAPMTLLLRTLTVPSARRVTAALRSRPIHVLTHPVTALLLNIGGMYVLYATPLYAASFDAPVLHYLIYLHFFAAGYLFCWAILAGPDPAPRPPSMAFRLGVLFVAMASHATLGKLMYGYLWPPNTHHSVEEIRTAAQIMYYGGDFAEVLLAIALFAMWYRAGGARPYEFFPSLTKQ